ncbi:hypothetical protein EXIGLDRAFT_837717 [Exidia glandulosa HHB12029]|uniref:Uncharacterized protein n=1 Tax=Exidia glandulosa HHB12029 TaxID=1314781 RepID=A0A165GI32_EXIGL|nr:hypothetical protein EXIGLDRAFT_837717 [Exidia glandulosa HHB12029]
MSTGRFSHQRKQLKFIVSGGLGSYFFHVVSNLFAIVFAERDAVPHSAKLTATLAVLLGTLTISLFGYLIGIPWIRNVQLDYQQWRASPELRTTISTLTVSIVVGWTLLVYALTTGSTLGFFGSFLGATSLYLLCFGLLGLIPVPRRL